MKSPDQRPHIAYKLGGLELTFVYNFDDAEDESSVYLDGVLDMYGDEIFAHADDESLFVSMSENGNLNEWAIGIYWKEKEL